MIIGRKFEQNYHLLQVLLKKEEILYIGNRAKPEIPAPVALALSYNKYKHQDR